MTNHLGIRVHGGSLVRVKRSSESAKVQIVQHDVAQFSRVQPCSVVQCSPEGAALLRKCSVQQGAAFLRRCSVQQGAALLSSAV